MTFKAVLISLGIFASMNSFAADNFSIYLTRHAEKENSQNDKNPSLTRCGKVRAQQLATLLSSADIKQIYSTTFQRTMQTALPLSLQERISIKNYNPRFLTQIMMELKQNRENTLVVGHSDTTPMIAEYLSGQPLEQIKEGEYQTLYQIQFIGEEVVLTTLTQPLECK
ncbi:phosphoglycerate mutase family protein [Colwellia sp. RSH04]|uniref:phosphoglycerate mutase family protein n=1 Tax=Colwellia sp. RSH04 TaxID=2305464 RepID=UPI002175608E|nr:phosphoglycerate mutase family protein [Colwellia sp. RSH04]